jgi:hypothetical protein
MFQEAVIGDLEVQFEMRGKFDVISVMSFFEVALSLRSSQLQLFQMSLPAKRRNLVVVHRGTPTKDKFDARKCFKLSEAGSD